MTLATKAFLEKAYLAYFGRPVDSTALTDYKTSTEAQVAGAFAASDESKALYGTTFSLAQIDAIYMSLFNRPAEKEGLEYWYAKVKDGTYTPAGAALAILNNAKNDDAKIIENKLAASALFTASLDTNTEMIGYSGDAAAASARAFLATVGLTAATSAQVTAAVAAAVAVQAVVESDSFTLTTSTDEFTGTAGNDTFTASTVAKLETDDVLDGGAGTDTLTVRVDDALTASPDISNIEIISLSRVSDTVDLTDTDLSDVTTLQVDDQRLDTTFTADTMPDTISIINTYSGGSDTAIEMGFTFDDAANESLNLSFSKAGVLNKNGDEYNFAAIAVDNGGDITDLTINVTGTNYVTLASTGSLDTVETLTLTGTGDLYLIENGSSFSAITTIDASALVGGLQLTGDTPLAAINDFSDFDGSLALEVVKGGSGSNRISVDAVTTDTVYTMQGGNDVIGAGVAEGDDTYDMGAGNDTVVASSGDITAIMGAGNDTIQIASGELDDNDSIAGGDGTATLRIDIANADTASTLIDDGFITGFETLRFDMAVDAAVTIDFDDFADISTLVLADTDLDDTGVITIENSDGKVINVAANLAAAGNAIDILSTDRNDAITLNVAGASAAGATAAAAAEVNVVDVDTVTLTATATAFYAAANLVGNTMFDHTASAILSGSVDNAETLAITMTATARASTAADGSEATADLEALAVSAVSTFTVTGTAVGAADNDATIEVGFGAVTVDTINVTLNASGATGDNEVTAVVAMTLDTVTELTLTVNDGFGGTDDETGVAIDIDAATTSNTEMTIEINLNGIVEALTLDATSAESVVFSLDVSNLLVASSIILEDTSTITVTGDGTIGQLSIEIADADTSGATAIIDLSEFTGDFTGDTAFEGIVITSADVATSILIGAFDLKASADEAYELDLAASTVLDTISFTSDMTGVFEITGFDDAEDLLDLSAFDTSFANILETAYDDDGDGTNESVLLTSKTDKFNFTIALVGVMPVDITAADYATF